MEMEAASMKRGLDSYEEPLNQKVKIVEVASESSLTVSPNKEEDPTRSKYFDFFVNNIYNDCDSGPFVLYVESVQRKSIHPMFIGKLIRINNFNIYKNVMSIIAIDRFKVKIELNSFNYANKLKKDHFFRENGLVAYIPSFMVVRKGVVRDIDYSLTDEEIKEFVSSEIEIVKAQRILLKKQGQSVPSPLVILSFKGQSLPQYINILGVHCKVEPYMQKVKQCRRCCRFGHIEIRCGYELRCPRCSLNHKESECISSSYNCIFCKQNHPSNSKQCVEFIKQSKIKMIMSERNVSFNEARNILEGKDNYSQKLIQIPNNKSNFHFPTLSHPQSSFKMHPEKIHQIIHVPNKSSPKPIKQSPNFNPIKNISNDLNTCTSPITQSNPIQKENNYQIESIKQAINNIFNQLVISGLFPEDKITLLSNYIKDLTSNLINNLEN